MSLKDKEKQREYDKEYRKKNYDRIRQKQNEYLNKPGVKEHLRKTRQVWYQRNKEEQNKKTYERNLRDKNVNREKFILKYAKARAKSKGLDFNLDISDIEIPEFCPVLNLRLETEVFGGPPRPSTPSLDRIDNSMGYIKGNIRIISWRANNKRSDMNFEECLALFLDALRLKESIER